MRATKLRHAPTERPLKGPQMIAHAGSAAESIGAFPEPCALAVAPFATRQRGGAAHALSRAFGPNGHRLRKRWIARMEYASSSLDLRHAATGRISSVVVPPRRLFAIAGLGAPEASGYELATRALMGASVAIRTALSGRGLAAPPRPASEALWWPGQDVAPDEIVSSFADRRRWHWEQMVVVPDAASDDQARDAIEAVRRDAGRAQPLVRLVEFTEGAAAQLLALGGAASEADALARLLEHVASLGREPAGRVHLIHLTPPDLVPLERRRVIVRLGMGGPL